MKKITTITIQKETKEKLTALGKKNESYNELLLKILNFVNKSDQWWEDR